MVHLLEADVTDLRTLAMAIGTGRADTAPPLSEALLALAETHGVDALLSSSPAVATATPALQASLKERRAAHEVLIAARDGELRRVLRALAHGSVRALVIKGAHLAHVLYAAPGLRPRADTDLAIDEAERCAAAAVLDALGYRPAVHVRGNLILGQWHFRRVEAGGLVHAIDLHWRIAAPLVFRHALPAARLRIGATAIPALGDAAFGPSLPDALAIACVHLVAHHRDAPQLLWLYEIAILARALDDEAARSFVATARDARVTAVCAAALNLAREYFDAPALGGLVAALQTGRGSGAEPSAAILERAGPLAEMWLDLKVCGGWRERVALLREHLYPDRDYVRATAGGRWMPWAYVRRVLRGGRRWTAISAAPDRTAVQDEWPAGSAAASRRPPPARTTR